MKIIYTISGLLFIAMSFVSCTEKAAKTTKKKCNYTVVLDLSDRILKPEQLDKDFYLIEKYFELFEKKSRKNLVLTSKNRFSVKIIPQKNSPLDAAKYEDLLHFYLDETDVAAKDKLLKKFGQSLSKQLQALKKEALYGKHSRDYFGVDIWAYLHDNSKTIEMPGYENTILIFTDGYFDFENQSHVIKSENKYTSTRFLDELTTSDWKQISESKEYGLLPIQLEKNTKWIVVGISSKKANDILQTEKITYFWKKWLTQSGVATSQFVLNGSNTEMSSSLLAKLQ